MLFNQLLPSYLNGEMVPKEKQPGDYISLDYGLLAALQLLTKEK